MSIPSRILRLPAVLFAALVLVPALPARAQDYPRLGLYWSVHRDGQPLLDSAGQIDPVVEDAVSRYDEIVVDVDPFSPYRPDVLQHLRLRHPGIKLLGYVTGHYIWYSADADSLNHYPTRYWRTVRDLDGFLYNRSGALFGLTNLSFADVNLAKRDAQGHYVVAEALAGLFQDAVLQNGNWDGLFIDTYCEGILWAQSAAESIDFVRAGYPDAASFDAGWRAGGDTLASRLRALAGPGPTLVGNCEPQHKAVWFNGWMRENFPYQGGGNWYRNMFDDPGGYFTEEQKMRAPRNNFIFSAASPPTAPTFAENLRRVRFGLASATLGDGYGVFGYGGRATDLYPYWLWWYDEYAVDLGTGHSSTSMLHTGWLGQPLGSWYQTIWAGSNPDASSNPDVETDLSGWTFFHSVPATLVRDTTTAARGRASLHVNVASAGAVDWYASLSTAGSIPVSYGRTYSATFWAKASSPRTIPVIASNIGERRSVTLGTTWQQYQVAFVSDQIGSSQLQFFLALDAGDVWLDDVHFQEGATTLYRRDFQHGIVLVNPADQDLTLPLEHSYQRILGLLDPQANDGATVLSQTVPAHDARFLITVGDNLPPAVVGDLRVSP